MGWGGAGLKEFAKQVVRRKSSSMKKLEQEYYDTQKRLNRIAAEMKGLGTNSLEELVQEAVQNLDEPLISKDELVRAILSEDMQISSLVEVRGEDILAIYDANLPRGVAMRVAKCLRQYFLLVQDAGEDVQEKGLERSK